MAELTTDGCARRRQRLQDRLAEQPLDAAVVTDVRDIYYLTGRLLPSDLPAALTIGADGRSILVAPDGYSSDAAERTANYSWNIRGTRDVDPWDKMIDAFRSSFPYEGATRVAVQASSIANRLSEALLATSVREMSPLDSVLTDMQACKDADEVAVLRESIAANLGAYDAVRDAIRPGVTELEVLAAGYRGAMQRAREKVRHDGDYQCGQYNGPARNRHIVAGELYIVDAWTCYRGYWADLSRTFVVGQTPTEAQTRLFEHIVWVLAEIEKVLRPAIDGTEVFHILDELIRQHPPLSDTGLVHHGGHGIGLRSHEMPDVNPQRGGKLQSGNVLSIEPGGYFAEARAGVRLENTYLITAGGCENLCSDQLTLHVCR